MDRDLLLKTADLIETLGLRAFSMSTYNHDIAAYLAAAAGKQLPPTDGPYFRFAEKLAGLPGDELLWVGGWPKPWQEMMEQVWANGEQARAQVAAYAVRDYVETGGWSS